MKKIITLIIALSLGVCAYAKTAVELENEFKALGDNWVVQSAWANENITDLKTAWNQFKSSPLSGLAASESFVKASATLSESEKLALNNRRVMYSYFYAQLGESFDATDAQKIAINAPRFFRNNPDKLTSIKSAGWIVDGVQLSLGLRAHIAFTIEDESLIYEARDTFESLDKNTLDNNISKIRRTLLTMKDVNKAKEICNAYENAMLIRECKNTDKIQAIGKALTARVVDAKISK